MKKVIIIEDHEDVRFSLAVILKREGFSVETAGDSGEAFKIIEKNFIPDFLIVDFNIPGMNGIETIKEMKKKCDAKSILLTGDISLMGNNYVKESINYFILKPYDPKKIIDILKQN